MSDSSITVLELLPPEIFVEIFCFLNGYAIYIAFYGLNHRLSSLVSINAIKYIDLCEITIKESRKILSDIGYSHIIALKLSNKYNDEQIDQLLNNNNFPLSNFNHLRSLTLDSIGIFTFHSLNRQDFNLFHLESLIIRFQSGQCKEKLRDMYRCILHDFCLRFKSLKVLHINSNNNELTIEHEARCSNSFSSGSMKVYSPLRYLNIDNVYIGNIDIVLSRFPNLEVLFASVKLNSTIFDHPLLSNLSSCSLVIRQSEFDSLVYLLKRCGNLKQLTICICPANHNALDNEKWENLIKNYLPKVKRFKMLLMITRIQIDIIQDLLTNHFSENNFWLERKTETSIVDEPLWSSNHLFVLVTIQFGI